jgi:hypothetical protein
MTVTVTLPDGGSDKYMRFGDAYVKNHDGTRRRPHRRQTPLQLRVRRVDRRRRRPEAVQEGFWR